MFGNSKFISTKKLHVRDSSILIFLVFELHDIRVNFSDFAAKNAKDERYKSIEKMRDREALFNEYMTDFRKNERERLKIRDEKVSTIIDKKHEG